MGYLARLEEMQKQTAAKSQQSGNNILTTQRPGGYLARLEEIQKQEQMRQQQKAAAEAARAEARTAELERQKNVRASSLMATLNEDGHVVLPKAGSATRTPSSSYSAQNAGILRTGFTAPDPLGTVGDVLDNIGVNQKRLEALESQPAYVDAGKDVNGRNRREYVGKDYGAISDTKSRINQQKAEFTRTAAERAAAGKTVEESRTQQLIDNRLSDAPIVRYSPTKSIDAQDMTAGQRQTYDYLYQTSPKSAKAYAESIAPEVNAKTAERESAAVKEYAKDHPVTAAGLNLFTSFANGASALDAAASAVTGKEYDPNSNLNRPTRITQATQEGLTEDIKNPFVKFLADTGLSTAQFLTKLPLGQTAALAVMSSGAAGQTAYDVKRSGGSTEQALLLGTIAGAAEATLEKLPLENLIGSFKGLDRTGIVAKLTSKIKQPIRDMLGSAIEEGGEEILTEYINNIADQLTRGDNSEMMQYKAQLMASGMSEAEAQKKALQQYYFLNPLLSFAGGALSGGALGGIASGSNALRTWAGDRASRMLEKAAEKAAAKATADTMDEAEINAAAGTAEATEADTGNYADVFSDVLDEEEIPQAEAWAEEDAAEPEPVPETVQVRAKTVLDDGMLPSVESEKLNKKAEAAKTDTAKSGIYAGVDEDDIRAAEYLSKVYGRKILFASDNYRINGKLENGTIYINPKGQNPIGQTLAHELMHTIEQSPDVYAQLYSVLQDVTRETGVNWSQRKEELTPIYAQVYQKDGRKFTDQDATYEVAAEVLSGMISDSKQLEAMARRNRNIVTRMWSRVKAIADRITGKYRIKVDEDTGEKRQKTNAELHADMYIREVENAFADALRKTKKQAKKAGAKYSFAGVNSKTADKQALQRAIDMQMQGRSAEDILRETGWYYGMGGKWRYEIDDSRMKYYRDGDAQLQNDPEYRRMAELSERYENLSEYERAELNTLEEKFEDVIFGDHGRELLLRDYISHDELFKAYPMLQYATLRFEKLPIGSRGFYDRRDNSIVLADYYTYEPEETLLHEIQHAIQQTEGLPGGSSMEHWEKIDQYLRSQDETRRKEILNSISREEANKYVRYKDLGKAMETIFETALTDEAAAERYEQYENEQDTIYRELYQNDWFHELLDLNEQIEKRSGDRSDKYREMYFNTAGEIEARDVSERRNLTAEQRREIMPNVGNENTVYAGGVIQPFSYVGTGRDGIRSYESEFPKEMTEKEKAAIFRDRIRTVFNLGMVRLNTDTKKITVTADRYTALENLFNDRGDETEYSAKINSLYDLADILATSKYNGKSTEPSYDPKTNESRKDIKPKNKAHAGVKYWYYFGNTIRMDGEVYDITFNVRDKGKEQYAYLVEFKKKNDTRYQLYENESSPVSMSRVSSGNSIPQSDGDVKPSGKKYSLTPEKAVGKEQAVAMLQEGISARQVYEQTGWFVDNDGIVRNNIDVKPDLSTPMKRRAYNSIHDTVKDYVDILTSDNHTKKFKRDLSDRLMQWYDRMSLVRDAQDYQKTNAEFIRAANEMAEEIVDSNLIKNHDNEEAAANIKAILTQPIKVPEDAKRDFHGKWGKWYSSQRKWLHQSNDNGTASDVVYMELSTEYPEYFPSDIEHPGDQLRKMAEVFELISSEDFVYDSYYDFEDGENQAEIDRQNIANMIIRGWEEINKMPRTEEEMLRDEVEIAKRMNKEEYEARLRQKEAEYQRHVDQAVLTQNIEISRINEEAQKKVKETKEKYRQREEERKNREEQNLLKKRQERERRHRMRGGDISLDKIAKAIADNTFTQKMERLYAELKRLDEYAGRFASIDIEKVESEKLKKEILKARQDADDARMYIRNVGRVLKEAHRNEALEFLRGGDVEKWVDKKTGLQYSVNTMTRNIRDISRGDAKGEEMIKKYFDPIAQHVATATRMKNSLRQRVADLNIKTTRNTSDQLSESAFVQLLGEARDNIYMLEHHLGYTNIYNGEEYRNGKTLQEWQDVINTLMVENPGISKNEEAMQRVENAIKEFKGIYDQLIGALNHTRILNGYEPIDYRHGYFPHYSSQTAPDGLFAELFKGLGVTPDTEDLPTTINGLTRKFRPGMQYQVFAQQRGENPGESYNGFRLDGMGAVEGFDRYIETAANVIFLTEDVQRLRALSNAIRYNASKKGIKEQIDIRRNDRNLSEDEKETVIEGLLANADTHLSNFVVELEEYTNLLAGKKSLRDREIEQYIGRGIYRMAKRLESRIAANMVALNPASWLTNFIPLTQAAAILKTGSMLGAMGDTIKAVKEEDGLVARSNFLTNRYGSERLVRTQSKQLSDTLSKPMEKIDSFVAQTIVRARYAENLANGMTESAAMQDADKFAAGIMGDRSFGQTPTIFNQQNPVTKLVTQYQLEVANQLMWMTKDLRMYAEDRKKFAEIIVKYLLFSFFYNFFYEAAIGRKPAFDPIGILNDAVGDFTGYSLPELSEIIGNAFDDEKTLQERMLNMFKNPKTKPSEAFGNLATSVAENLPFTSVAGVLIDDFDAGRLPVASAIPNIGNLGGLLDPGKSAKSKAYTAYKELSKPAAYLLPPFGGGQIKKTLEGAAAIAQGGSYVPDAQGRGQLQYPVYRTNPLDIAGALVFGKSTTQGGREWVDSGFQTLSAKKTEAFQNAMEAGATRKEAYNAVKSIKGSSVSEKRQALDGLKLDGDVKASLYYDTLASEKERGVLDAMGRTEEAYTLLRDLKGVTGNARKAEILAKAKGLTESQRETAFDNMVTDAYTDRIERVKKAGAGFNDFLQVYSTFSAAVGDEKKLKTIDAIDALNLTDAQKDALYLCFYTESNLHNTPWNNSMPLFQIPEVSLPEIRLPQINIPKINLPY